MGDSVTGDPTRPTSRWRAGVRLAAYGLLALAALAAAGVPASAEDLRGRWYFGVNIGFLSTTDDVRSNAHINIGPAGDDGIPFTGDPNELVRCDETNLNQGPVTCDARPDHLLARELTIEETFKLDLTGGYGLSSWLSLQVDASYFKGDVGPVDGFARQFYPHAVDPNFNPVPTSIARSEESFPIIAGQITEIPVSITGVVRFRKDSTLNPYVGAGAGIIFAQMDVSGDVGALNQRLNAMHIQAAANEFGENLNPVGGSAADGTIPFQYPLVVDVDDAFEWHLTGGIEYFFNDRLSMVFDAKYMFADQSLELLFGDQDQVNMQILPEQLFRADGSVKLFVGNEGGQGAEAPNPFCIDSPNAPAFDGGGASGGGCPTMGGNESTRVSCTANSVGDFDGDGARPGDPDICYNRGIWNAAPFNTPPIGQVVVQGGEIDLTGFSVAVGMRFHF